MTLKLTNVRAMNADKTILTADFLPEDTPEDVDVASICLEPGVDGYQQALDGEYGEIEPYVPNELSPELLADQRRAEMFVTRLQLKAILHQRGLLEDVEAFIRESDFILQLAWKESTEILRTSQLMKAIQQGVRWPDGTEITDNDLDDLFSAGAEIQI